MHSVKSEEDSIILTDADVQYKASIAVRPERAMHIFQNWKYFNPASIN